MLIPSSGNSLPTFRDNLSVPPSRIETRKPGKVWVVILSSVVPGGRFDAGDRMDGMCSHQCCFEGRRSGREDFEQVQEGETEETIYMSKVRERKRKESRACN